MPVYPCKRCHETFTSFFKASRHVFKCYRTTTPVAKVMEEKRMEKVNVVGVKRAPGCLYYVSKEGNVVMLKKVKGSPAVKEVVAFTQIRKEPGYLYFLDKEGDVSRARMGRKPKKPVIA